MAAPQPRRPGRQPVVPDLRRRVRVLEAALARQRELTGQAEARAALLEAQVTVAWRVGVRAGSRREAGG